jgi:RNA-directed DNA polymerase
MESRLREKEATTGDGTELPETFAVNGKRLPEKLFMLRQKLYLKAKREPEFRFYVLYDRIYRRDVLEAAWVQVARNGGKPGVDGVTIKQIKDSPGGPEALVAELHQELKELGMRFVPPTTTSCGVPSP